MKTTIDALSPLDGRYYAKMTGLNALCSEYGLHKARVVVEIRWLQALSQTEQMQEVPLFSAAENDFLAHIITDFSITDAEQIKAFEQQTNHDVKAVEYFLKAKLEQHETLKQYTEFIHFACTSEDINNLAYGIMTEQAALFAFATSIRGHFNKVNRLSP